MRINENKGFAVLSATAITIGTCLPASLAFATPPDTGDQSGSGATNLTMIWENANQEYGGTDEPQYIPSPDGPGTGTHDADGTEHEGGDYIENPAYNPDGSDDNDWGDNLAFSAPSAINFVAKANGTLIAPEPEYVHIDNHSSFEIRVSHMQVEQNNEQNATWNIVENATAATGANSVWGSIGPSGDALNWYTYKSKGEVTTPNLWNMAATGAASNADKVYLTAAGNVAHLDIDLSTAQRFGTIHWYLKAGNAAASEPALPASQQEFEALNLSQLSAIGEYLRGDADQTYVTNAETALVGKTTTVTLANNNTMEVRCVDVSHERGLTFEAILPITTAALNADQNATSGWADSDLRQSMNQTVAPVSGGIYATYFQGTTLDTYVHAVDNISKDYGNATNISQNDRYWVPSATNIFGSDWGSMQGGPYNDPVGETQFDYYSTQTIDSSGDANITNPACQKRTSDNTHSDWQLRSAFPSVQNSFAFVNTSGNISFYFGTADHGIVPYFCL